MINEQDPIKNIVSRQPEKVVKKVPKKVSRVMLFEKKSITARTVDRKVDILKIHKPPVNIFLNK